MFLRLALRPLGLPAMLAGVMLILTAAAPGLLGAEPDRYADPGVPAAKPAAPPAAQPAAPRSNYRVAERSEVVAPNGGLAHLQAGDPNEHPLMPALRWAKDGIVNLQKIEDYSATVVKRERINGKLNEHEYMFVKVRHKPFSVYMNFLAPNALKGQEVIFIDGANDGKMWAHAVGFRAAFGTVSLKPDGHLAMQNQRYPITQLGILNLTKRLIEVAEQDVKYGECEVKFFKGAKINDRMCTCAQVIHPTRRSNFLFNVARIFVDDELNVPIRYEAYDWPKTAGGAPELMEEYTYLNYKPNNGFTDVDFDIKNPKYGFR